MNLLASLNRPEYVFRPSQIIRRLKCEWNQNTPDFETHKLPWGSAIRVRPDDSLGSQVRRLGIYELPTSECILRLTDPGDLAVDVGANVGHMTSAMAVASGSSGAVLAFEPQPILFGELAYNVAQWQQDDRSSPIAAHNIALSDHSGTSQLMVPANFYGNRGLSYLIESPVHAEIDVVAREVEVSTLDEAIEPGKRVALMKLDVEGAELHVLKGAERLLKSGLIRDILFEEHRTLPTPVTSFLDALGYSLFLLDARLMGPTIVPVGSRYAPASRDAPNYLATLDPKRAIARMTPRYWKVYSGEYPGHYS